VAVEKNTHLMMRFIFYQKKVNLSYNMYYSRVYVTGSEVVSDLTSLVHVPIFKLPLIVCSSDL